MYVDTVIFYCRLLANIRRQHFSLPKNANETPRETLRDTGLIVITVYKTINNSQKKETCEHISVREQILMYTHE